MPESTSVAVLLLGGQENALSLARSFGRKKILVFISASAGCHAVKSRYCTKSFPVPKNQKDESYWYKLLLQEKPEALQGCVIFPGSDVAVEFLAFHKRALSRSYILDDSDSGISLAMLNKQKTLELAMQAGCPAPLFHCVSGFEDIAPILDSITYPIMIKPVYSHLFYRYYPGKKYLIAQNSKELHNKIAEMLDKKLELIITEIIPGPDNLQSAYFTYITHDGQELFNYTHQIIRRYPKNCGLACLTETKALPATADAGRRFFQKIGLSGMAHVEFKLDTRDGLLKLIECNPRMSAAQAVATKSGMDMAWRIYNYLLYGTVEKDSYYQYGVRRWWVYLDIKAYIELRHLGELSFVQWLKSIKGPPIVFPYFCLDDPKPFIYKNIQHFFSSLSTRANLLCQKARESPIR